MEENKTKTEEEIREEVRAELQKEAEIKEQAKKELEEEQKKKEMKKYNSQNRKRSVFKFFYNIIITLVILFVLFETIMGLLDMQRLNDEKEPYWYLDVKEEENEGQKITKYNLGLYVIKKVQDSKGIKIVLKPFFFKD